MASSSVSGSSRSAPDEELPSGGGVMRRIAAGAGAAGFGGAFAGAFEQVFAPQAAAARVEREERKRRRVADPAVPDPPSPDEATGPMRTVVAPGRGGTPFSGSLVLRPERGPAGRRRPAG